MRQSVPVRPALLSLATGAAFVLATPAVASQGQHTQIPPASAQRQPPPDLLTLPRIDIPLPEHRPGDDTVQLAAGEVLSLELPIAITALFEPGWEDLDETQQEILAPFAPEWNTWPIAEKRSWLAFADRMQRLSASAPVAASSNGPTCRPKSGASPGSTTRTPAGAPCPSA